LLTTARQAHTLTREQAGHAYPVRIRGVVTYYDPYLAEGRTPALFVQDASGGIFVQTPTGVKLPIHAGSVVEVSGVTAPGGYAPILSLTTLKILGSSRPLPSAIPSTLPHLLTGVEDSQWVKIEGIVHSVAYYAGNVVLTLAMIDGQINATAVKEPGRDYASLIDSRVVIGGVAGPSVDNKGQMTGVHLLTPGWDYFTPEKPVPQNAFELPVRPLNTVLQYSSAIALQHRIHVQGRLTLFWPGRSLCIQNGTDGLCVQTRDTTEFKYGELVDVVGFPARDNSMPTLSDATFRRAGNIMPNPARSITAEQALTGRHQAELVQIRGKLVGKSLVMTDSALLISTGNSVFLVILPPSLSAEKKDAPSWIDGSDILVTGILSGKMDMRRESVFELESFQILMRSRDDIHVISTPSWLTAQNALVVLSIVLSVTVAIFVWVIVLRHRVEQQTLLIRRSEERFRHQAEHDSLTGLTSRASLHEQFSVALDQARRNRTPLAVLMMDVDNFKHINDSLGHAAGDEVLCTVARRLRESVRKSDTLARMGGDEFLGLMAGIYDVNKLNSIMAKIVSNVSAPIYIDGRLVPVSISVGVSTYPESGEDAPLLLHNGDMAMYRAKVLGRNCYQIFSPDMADESRQKPGLPVEQRGVLERERSDSAVAVPR
jgi:diguanylate cyclase (GGDEF)-like protein